MSEMSVGSIRIPAHMRRSEADCPARKQAGEGLLLHVEVARLGLHLPQLGMRMHEAPVGEHDYMFTVMRRPEGARRDR